MLSREEARFQQVCDRKDQDIALLYAHVCLLDETLKDFTVAQYRDRLSKKGLRGDGLKEDLIHRLKEHHRRNPSGRFPEFPFVLSTRVMHVHRPMRGT